MKIINLKHLNIFGYDVLIWWNNYPEFKLIKIDNRMYKKYSFYIWKFIFEIGQLKYGTNYKSVSTISK